MLLIALGGGFGFSVPLVNHLFISQKRRLDRAKEPLHIGS